MGATPKQRISRKHRGDRRAHAALKPVQLVECPHCHSMRMPHHVCPTCGTYRGRQVLRIKSDDTAQA